MEIANILPINEVVIEKTIAIRQSKKIALGDAIIAATALVYNHTLVTHNTKDFIDIESLKVVNPYDM